MAEECQICLEEYDEDHRYGQKIEWPGCGRIKHYFHQQCAADWLTVNRSCPLCKTPIFGREPT